MILIEYIDRERATREILRAWHDQQWKAEEGKDYITQLDLDMVSFSPAFGATPVQGGGNKQQERMCAQIDKKMVAELGYNRAKEFFKELYPRWERLSAEEQYMLEARFVDAPSEGSGVRRIMERYNISRTVAYERSNAALKRLSTLIFW